MRIAISAESTIDMPKNLLEKYNITSLPFTVIMGDNEYFDGEINNSDIFKFVEEKNILPKTSAINEFQYTEHFKNLLKDYDWVVHISLSSEISCAYKNACTAAEKLKNIYVVDSRSLSTGIALLAIKASEMVKENKEVKDIVNSLRELTTKVQASFVLDKLTYLRKGGRCSALTALGANLLKIKPQILVENGKMGVGKKYLGSYESAVIKYCQDTLKSNPNLDKEYAFLTYTTSAEGILNKAEQMLKEHGFKNIYKTVAGSTITSHCGPNTLGILFIKK